MKDLESGAWQDAKTHCHGSAWKVKDDSDFQWKYRKEIFDHVVVDDHGFKRGYWGGIKDNNGKVHLRVADAVKTCRL
mgnify:CR=1 FL=1